MRTVLAAWNSHQQERVLSLLHPDIVFDATRRVVNPKTYVGMDGMRRMIGDRDEIWEEFRTEPDEFIDAGSRVVVVGSWVGKGKGQRHRGSAAHSPRVHSS